MVTIQDVARKAGVSVATVSRVINDKAYVREALRERVRHAIDELDYEPNILARNWRTRTTRTLAAVVASIAVPHEAWTLQTAGEAALAHDYTLIVCNTARNAGVEKRHLRLLRQRRIDGVLLNTMGHCEAEIRALAEQQVAVVMLNRPLVDYGPGVDAVVVDSQRGSSDAVAHLIRVGHRRIGLLCGPSGEFHSQERRRGYRDALAAHDLPYDEALVRFGNYGAALSTQAIDELIGLPSPPTAIFAAAYPLGLAALTALRLRRLRVPDDMALVVYDDVLWSEFIDPPLTLVANPARELGCTAMDLLFARLADHSRPPQQVWLTPRLLVGRSCGWTGPSPTDLQAPGDLAALAERRGTLDRPAGEKEVRQGKRVP